MVILTMQLLKLVSAMDDKVETLADSDANTAAEQPTKLRLVAIILIMFLTKTEMKTKY